MTLFFGLLCCVVYRIHNITTGIDLLHPRILMAAVFTFTLVPVYCTLQLNNNPTFQIWNERGTCRVGAVEDTIFSLASGGRFLTNLCYKHY